MKKLYLVEADELQDGTFKNILDMLCSSEKGAISHDVDLDMDSMPLEERLARDNEQILERPQRERLSYLTKIIGYENALRKASTKEERNDIIKSICCNVAHLLEWYSWS